MARELKKTPLHAWHREHGGQMVEFAGWEMPVSYRSGIIEEHLGTRRYGGLFDISHRGRFSISGKDGVPFLQHVLTNNVLALDPGMAQYTMIPTEKGGALDDAYLYRLDEDDAGAREYLLVVNAVTKERDWDWFMEQKKRFSDLVIEDKTSEIGMMTFQGAPDDEGFTAASCLRMGVQEMTRFGMKEQDFEELADYVCQVILHGRSLAGAVSQCRKRFAEMKYCLPVEEAAPLIRKLWEALG